MKIVHVTTHFSPFRGGLEYFVQDLAIAQSKKHEVSVITLSKTTKKEPSIIGVRRHPGWEILKKKYTIPKPGFTKQIKKTDPEVIFTHTRFFLTSYLAGKWAQKKSVRWIHVEHGQNEVVQSGKNIKKWGTKLGARVFDLTFGKWVLRQADEVVVMTQKGKEFVKKYGRKKHITVIPHGIKIPEKIKPLPRKNRILWYGRPIREKGLEELVDIISKSHAHEFWICVPEKLSTKYRKKLQKHPSAFVFENCDREEIWRKIEQSDITLNLSHSEGFGLVILEAGSRRRPILSTRVGIAPQIISKAFFCEDSNEFVQKISHLLHNYTELEKEGQEIHKIIQKDFSWETMLSQYDTLLKEN